MVSKTYLQRAEKHTNPSAKALLETIERKRSNLCVSVDVTKQAELLHIVDVVGPYICLVKAKNPPPELLPTFMLMFSC